MAGPERRPAPWLWVLGGTGILLVLIVRAAWLCDDAYITLRTIDNFVSGFGLRWNVVERVQTFTHPAWMFLITPFYAITREAYVTVIGIQLALAAITVGLCIRVLAASGAAVVLAVAVLASSRAFVDFSTSGLENGLVHLLLVAFVVVWQQERAGRGGLAWLGAVTSGLLLCRLDLGALVAPLLVLTLWPVSRARLASFVLGLLPFAAWEAFSLVYYGQLVPNTALAKLPVGVPLSDLAVQGFRYVSATFHFDPVTPVAVIGTALALAWMGGREGRAMAAGIGLHLLAVILVGGDFMSGRFLTPALVMAVIGILTVSGGSGRPRLQLAVAAAVLAAGAFVPGSAFRTSASFGAGETPAEEFARHGVTDERRFYYPALGLLRVLRGQVAPTEHPWATIGLAARARSDVRVVPASNVGLFGYYAGPRIYVIDRNALTDPFLARLPPQAGWRVGHYLRAVPPEYEDSRRAGKNLMGDSDLRQLYARVELVTQGEIWRGDRLKAILASLLPTF